MFVKPSDTEHTSEGDDGVAFGVDQPASARIKLFELVQVRIHIGSEVVQVEGRLVVHMSDVRGRVRTEKFNFLQSLSEVSSPIHPCGNLREHLGGSCAGSEKLSICLEAVRSHPATMLAARLNPRPEQPEHRGTERANEEREERVNRHGREASGRRRSGALSSSPQTVARQRSLSPADADRASRSTAWADTLSHPFECRAG